MIGRLRGILLEKAPPHLLVEVHGVGYELLAPLTAFYQLPAINAEVCLFTHFVVREDAQLLYGFARLEDRDLFRLLLRANGVGPKLALAILSGLESAAVVAAIRAKAPERLHGIPGVGKKTAERLVVELQDVVQHWQVAGVNLEADVASIEAADVAMQDAIRALTALGYKLPDAKRTIQAIYTPTHSTEQLLRLALQRLTQGVYD